MNKRTRTNASALASCASRCLLFAGLSSMASSLMAQSMVAQLRAERAAQLGAEPVEQAENWLATHMLANPASPYSTLVPRPGFTNELYWWALMDKVTPARGQDDVLAQLASELGLTRARPGVDVQPKGGFRDPFVAAHATKAGLDADIFWHVLDVFGYQRAHHFATHALGLQVLRDQMKTAPAERQAALGIYADVHDRVMRARHADQLSDYDLRYLDILVQDQLLHPGKTHGLPAAWRVARIAAAFRDARGYVAGPPCRPDASPQPDDAGTGAEGDLRTPCLVAAHDRAVHRWYVDELYRLPPAADKPHGGLARIGALLGALLPLLDMVALAEVVEAAVADDMAATGAISRAEAEAASERAARVTCSIRG